MCINNYASLLTEWASRPQSYHHCSRLHTLINACYITCYRALFVNVLNPCVPPHSMGLPSSDLPPAPQQQPQPAQPAAAPEGAQQGMAMRWVFVTPEPHVPTHTHTHTHIHTCMTHPHIHTYAHKLSSCPHAHTYVCATFEYCCVCCPRW
jgi:hypothetical protein